MTADLVIAALNMALVTRRPDTVIHHSDQGSQYASIAFGKRCKAWAFAPRSAREVCTWQTLAYVAIVFVATR